MSLSPNKPTILCVDDSEDILVMIKSLLEMDGYQVVTAPTGKLGLNALKSNFPISAAVVDYEMPGMNGLELAQEIKHFDPCIPVLLFSASDPTDQGICDDFIRKGSGARVLLKAVRCLISRQWVDKQLLVSASPSASA